MARTDDELTTYESEIKVENSLKSLHQEGEYLKDTQTSLRDTISRIAAHHEAFTIVGQLLVCKPVYHRSNESRSLTIICDGEGKMSASGNGLDGIVGDVDFSRHIHDTLGLAETQSTIFL